MQNHLLQQIAGRLSEVLPDHPAAAALPSISGVEEVREGLPSWWHEGGNRLFLRPGVEAPALCPGGDRPTRGALVVLNGPAPPAMAMIWGEAALVVIGEGCRFPHARLFCSHRSTIVIGDWTGCTSAAVIDCRNGGLIHVGADGLWAPEVKLQTDDLHAIRDLSGKRVNAFGGRIIIEPHVWLGLEALVFGGSHIEQDVIVGARSVVKGRLGANSVYAGAPARLVREAVTWSFEDLP